MASAQTAGTDPKGNLAFLAGLMANPKVHYLKVCQPDCVLPAHSPEYVPAGPDTPYLTLGTLSLPMGNYFVTAKFSAYNSNSGWYVLECGLIGSDGSGDWSSAGFNAQLGGGNAVAWAQGQSVLHFQTPVSFPTREGGTVTLKCRAVGQTYWVTDPPTVTEMHLWGGSIAAVQVGVVKQ